MSVVVDFTRDYKVSALYFDAVVPVAMGMEGQYFEESEGWAEFLPESMKANAELGRLIREVTHACGVLHLKWALGGKKSSGDDPFEQPGFSEYIEARNNMLTELDRVEPNLIQRYGDDGDAFGNIDSIELSLANIPVIDAQDASWSQIEEFRKDEKSVKNLRRLKLFFHKNYIDKPKTFVEDDLSVMLEDYQNSIADWGFTSKTGAISTLLTSKSILSGAAAGVVSVLGGSPILAASTLAAGAVIEIGNISVNIATAKHNLLKLERDSPVGYIVSANRSLGKA